MRKYSLFELQAYLQRVIALNFNEPVWVTAEIFQIKQSRGHLYLELIQKKPDSQEVCAQSQAVIWSKNQLKIRQILDHSLDDLVMEGMEVSLQVEISYHPVFGLKLSILNIDANYTLGKMELHRQETIMQLKKEGLLELNAKITPAAILQKIAVISSANASGFHDFAEHLRHNDFGYIYDIRIFASALQGRQVESDLLFSLDQISKQANNYDCVVIIRGGGSKLDLAGFDSFNIARAISMCPIPVFTGIGHETDTTVADLVAHRAFKTPTAVASFLVDHNANTESTINQIYQKILQRTRKLHSDQKERLSHVQRRISQTSVLILQKAKNQLLVSQQNFNSQFRKRLELEIIKLDHLQEKINLLNPLEILQKGYTLTLFQGIRINKSFRLEKGDSITTIFSDGKVESIVEKIN